MVQRLTNLLTNLLTNRRFVLVYGALSAALLCSEAVLDLTL